jgi:NAD+ synthase (glutamine-hydrolysing)
VSLIGIRCAGIEQILTRLTGLDSSTVALFVYSMARLVLYSIKQGEETTLADLRRVTGIKDFSPKTPQEIVSRLLHTCYMGTVNSGDDTRSRAKELAKVLGAYHTDITIGKTAKCQLWALLTLSP